MQCIVAGSVLAIGRARAVTSKARIQMIAKDVDRRKAYSRCLLVSKIAYYAKSWYDAP